MSNYASVELTEQRTLHHAMIAVFSMTSMTSIINHLRCIACACHACMLKLVSCAHVLSMCTVLQDHWPISGACGPADLSPCPS